MGGKDSAPFIKIYPNKDPALYMLIGVVSQDNQLFSPKMDEV